MVDNPTGIDIKKDVINRPITHEDIYYLLLRYAHLHVCDPNEAYVDYATPAKSVKMPNGWTIIDHGDLLRTSAPHLSMDGYNGLISDMEGQILPPKDGEDEGEGGTSRGGQGGFLGGQGTVVWQMALAAQEMTRMAMDRWDGVHILSGFYGMKRACWIAVKSFGRTTGKEIPFSGFEPRDEDWVVYHYVQDICGGAKPLVSSAPAPSG